MSPLEDPPNSAAGDTAWSACLLFLDLPADPSERKGGSANEKTTTTVMTALQDKCSSRAAWASGQTLAVQRVHAMRVQSGQLVWCVDINPFWTPFFCSVSSEHFFFFFFFLFFVCPIRRRPAATSPRPPFRVSLSLSVTLSTSFIHCARLFPSSSHCVHRATILLSPV